MREDGPNDSLANFLIDAADRLSGATAPGRAWAVANELAQDVGVTAINVGCFCDHAIAPLWARSSTSEAWQQEYFGNGYAAVDPFLIDRLKGGPPATYEAGVLRRDAARDPREWEMNHGLRAAGYSLLVCKTFTECFGAGQRLVVLATDTQPADFLASGAGTALSVLGALISAHVPPPDREDNAGMVAFGYELLTPRERDVLCLRAHGMSTGRIAETLGLAEVTVRKHFSSARSKMGANTRDQALVLALLRGQLDL